MKKTTEPSILLSPTTAYADLHKRAEELRRMNFYLHRKLKEMPEGNLYIRKVRGHVQYYLGLPEAPHNRPIGIPADTPNVTSNVTTSATSNAAPNATSIDDARNPLPATGTETVRERRTDIYLDRSQLPLIHQLAHKKYYEKVLKAGERELEAIDSLMRKGCDPEEIREIHARFPEETRTFLQPVDLTDREYATEWQKCEWEHKEFREDMPLLLTEKGERVRSKSEILIANALAERGIPYRYEYPLKLRGMTIHPDFTILRTSHREVWYWEHLGMMDRLDYGNEALERIEAYERAGIYPGKKLILTHETIRKPLNSAIIEEVISEYLM